MVGTGVHDGAASFTACFMRAHQHLDAGVALLRETHPGRANEMASYINRIYALLVEVQDDTEPVFTGNDLIAYDTTKGLAKAGGLSSLELLSPVAYKPTGPSKVQVDCLTSSLLEQPGGFDPVPVAAAGDGGPQHFASVSSPSDQRPPLTRPPAPDSNVAQATSGASVPATFPTPLSQSWASVTAKGNAIGTTLLAVPSTLSRPTRMPEPLLGPLSPNSERTQQMRVVWIYNCPPQAKLPDISKLIREGPVKSISFSNGPGTTTTRAACIVFRLAKDAAQFLEAAKTFTDVKWVKNLRFEAGEPFPHNQELLMMDPPISARRRLTIVRGGLFAGPNAKSMFHLEVYKVVRRTAVELIFFYNQGNATVVLDSVANALALKSHFDLKARIKDTPFSGIQATFSKDPCEHTMRLVSGMERDKQLRVLRTENEGSTGSRSATVGSKKKRKKD